VSPAAEEVLIVVGREVAISHPDKLLSPTPRHTKLDLAHCCIAVREGALCVPVGHPNMLVRNPPNEVMNKLAKPSQDRPSSRRSRSSLTPWHMSTP
jgi:hypothetical protein